MKAWLLDRIGDGIESLRLGDVPDSAAGPGEVVLALKYAALNPADRYLAMGQYPGKPALPHILGRDGVGTVIATAPDVRNVEIGQTMAILRGETGVTRAGTFAQRVAIAAKAIVPVPAGWTIEEAAGATLVYNTAYQALTQFGDLPPGAVVLVTGASGGVGVASVQLARAMGHTVLALSRSKTKCECLRELGAAATFDPQDPGWRDAAKSFLGKRRVDLAIDNIGGQLFNDVLTLLGDRGKVSVVGRLAGPVPEFNTATLFFRRILIGGVAVGSYTNEESHAAWNNVLQLMHTTNAKPLVDRIFRFDQISAAFNRLEEGPMGKVLIRVAEQT